MAAVARLDPDQAGVAVELFTIGRRDECGRGGGYYGEAGGDGEDVVVSGCGSG